MTVSRFLVSFFIIFLISVSMVKRIRRIFLKHLKKLRRYTLKLLVSKSDNEDIFIDFVNANQILKEDIVLIEPVRGLITYRLFWF